MSTTRPANLRRASRPVAEEALATALCAARMARSFDEGLRIAVTHSGDSDSTGAVAGSLLGLPFLDEALAHRWRAEVDVPI